MAANNQLSSDVLEVKGPIQSEEIEEKTAAQSTAIIDIAKNDSDCVAPSLLDNNVQQTSTANDQLPSDVLEVKRPIQSEEIEKTAVQSTAVDVAKNDGDCVAPSLLDNNVQQTSTANDQLPSDVDCEPDVLEVDSVVQSEEIEEKTAVQSTAIDVAKSDGDCVAPSLLANNVQQTTTANDQLPSDVDCEPDVLEVESVVQSEEIEEKTAVQSTAVDVAKSDGDELEPSVTTATVKSAAAAAAEQPMQDRRGPSIMSALGNRLLKVGRLLFCCCCRPNNID